jgi:hypothetical protein
LHSLIVLLHFAPDMIGPLPFDRQGLPLSLQVSNFYYGAYLSNEILNVPMREEEVNALSF